MTCRREFITHITLLLGNVFANNHIVIELHFNIVSGIFSEVLGSRVLGVLTFGEIFPVKNSGGLATDRHHQNEQLMSRGHMVGGLRRVLLQSRY